MNHSTFKSYALLGSGRLAYHLQYYLKQLELPFKIWSRNGNPAFNSEQDRDGGLRLLKTLRGTSHVLLAVKDEAIADVLLKIQADQIAVHFSGALRIEGAVCAHPLMTFGEQQETLEWYRRIPFVVDEGQVFSEILPGLPNVHVAVAPERRMLYHALCSLAGNSTYLLWQAIGREFKEALQLSPEVLTPFLHQVVENAARGGPLNFTGPVARGDWRVVRAHLDALAQNPTLFDAYKSYLTLATQSGFPPPKELAQ